MKSKKRSSAPSRMLQKGPEAAAAARTAIAPKSGSHFWYYVLGVAAATFLAFQIYSPATHGPFVLDDRYLPFFAPGWAEAPLKNWISGVRPLLMFTFWWNFQIGQTDPQWYHIFNIVLHLGNAILIWLIVERIL